MGLHVFIFSRTDRWRLSLDSQQAAYGERGDRGHAERRGGATDGIARVVHDAFGVATVATLAVGGLL